MKKWGKYLLWIIGMFVIMYLGNHWIDAAHKAADATFKPGPYLWVTTAVRFLFGVYLSFLFVKRPSRINVPLLILVFLPSFLSLIYLPIAFSTHIRMVVWVMWMTQGSFVQTFEGVVAGFSLMIALFG